MSSRASILPRLLALLVGVWCAAEAADTAAPPVAAQAPAALVPIGPVPGPGSAPPLPENPLGDSAEARLHGRELFEVFNCIGCHGGHAGGGMGPSLRDDVWHYGGSDAHIYSSIAQGRALGMPAWGALLPEQEIWALVAYLKSLRTPQEPRPPR